MKLKQLLKQTRSSLDCHGIVEAPLESELLLMKAVGLGRSSLYASLERPVTPEELGTLSLLLSCRLTGKPWPYISGYREFYGLNLRVWPGVFIPRPETELLVDLAIEHVRRLSTGPPVRIADVGTGSGAIAIALAVHLPQTIMFATDTSPQALEAALLNCHSHRVSQRVILLEGNLLEPVPGPVDMVVSNPPYIPRGQMPHLQREIQFEPPEALDGGADGLDVVRSLISQARNKLGKGSVLIVEVGPQNASEARDLAQILLPGWHVSLVWDMAGNESALLAKGDW